MTEQTIPAPPQELHINALVTETGVNMGDHAQDVTKAAAITPDMTVREVCEKYLFKHKWGSGQRPDDGKTLTLRLAVDPAEEDQ